MNTKIITISALVISSLYLVSAMEMHDMATTSMKKNMIPATVDHTSMNKEMAASPEVFMYNNVTMTSSKEDIVKLQMMLVEGGYLIMPKNTAYGFYGPRTKKAFAMFKKSSMVKDSSMMKMDTSKAGAMMKDDMMKKDTMNH